MAKIRIILYIVILEYALLSKLTTAQNQNENDGFLTSDRVDGSEGSGEVRDADDDEIDLTTFVLQSNGTQSKRHENDDHEKSRDADMPGRNKSCHPQTETKENSLKLVFVIAGFVSGACAVIVILNCSQLCVLVRVLQKREKDANDTNNTEVPIPKIIVDKGSDDKSEHTFIELDDATTKSDEGHGNDNPNPNDQTSPVNGTDKGEETDKQTDKEKDKPPTDEQSPQTDACGHADGISLHDDKNESQTAKATQEPSSITDVAVTENDIAVKLNAEVHTGEGSTGESISNQISDGVKPSSAEQAPLPNDQMQVLPAETDTNDNDFDTHKHIIPENEPQHEVGEELKSGSLYVSENTGNESVSVAKNLAENDGFGVGEEKFDFSLSMLSEVGMAVGTSDRTDEFPEISHL